MTKQQQQQQQQQQRQQNQATVFKISNFNVDKYYKQLEQQHQKIVDDPKKMLQATDKMEETIMKARNERIQKLKNVRNGDLVEFTKESGYRMNGVFMIKKTEKTTKLVKLSTEYSDYGTVNPIFSLNKDVLPGYWTYARFTFASWYLEPNPEPINCREWKNKTSKDLVSEIPGELILDLGWVKLFFFDRPKAQVMRLLKNEVLYFNCDEDDDTDCGQMYLHEDFYPNYQQQQQQQQQKPKKQQKPKQQQQQKPKKQQKPKQQKPKQDKKNKKSWFSGLFK